MQYVLTKKELDNLVDREKYRSLEMAMNTLAMRLLRLADFECIHDSDFLAERGRQNKYCDGCPLQKTDTPIPKHEIDYEEWMSRIWCPFERRYPK